MVGPKPAPVQPVATGVNRKNFTIVVDAGHGGKDHGAIREGIREKDLNLNVALKLRDELQSRGYTVFMTRTEDEFLSLKEITEEAASYKPDIFISVHHNSSTNPAIYGLETYYYHGFSLNLAKDIHTNLASSLPVVDRGVRQAKFYVINHTSVPSVLLELGYVSNATEREAIANSWRQKQEAKAIADGVDAYLKRIGR
jgi:N-acetylmuramoyl-L-alanine amidase